MWRKGALYDPQPATNVVVDFLELLQKTLKQRGLTYEVVAYAAGFDTEVPLPTLGFDGRLSIADVILARTDLPISEFKILYSQQARYKTNLSLATAAGTINLFRQWASVDFKLRGKKLRFVSTHLEPYHPGVRVAQALELLALHSNTQGQVIFVGDFNSEAGITGDAVQLFLDHKLTDVWELANPGLPGATCCQEALLDNAESKLNRRIDYIFVAGDFEALEAALLGENPEDKTASGHWPSDHAGLVGTIVFRSEQPETQEK